MISVRDNENNRWKKNADKKNEERKPSLNTEQNHLALTLPL